MSLFGDKLHEFRTLSGMKMIDLANVAGVSQPYLSELEHGKKFPSEELIKKLSVALSSNRADRLFTIKEELSSAFRTDKLTLAYNTFSHLNVDPTEETYKQNISLLLDTLSLDQLKEVQDYIDFRFVQPDIRSGKKKKDIE